MSVCGSSYGSLRLVGMPPGSFRSGTDMPFVVLAIPVWVATLSIVSPLTPSAASINRAAGTSSDSSSSL